MIVNMVIPTQSHPGHTFSRRFEYDIDTSSRGE